MLSSFIRFKFSIRNYYLLLSVSVVGLFVYSWMIDSIKPIIVFMVFAVVGVLGETLINFWWQMFFGQRLWVYSTETLYHKYTSLLNFIPWGIGGYLYLITARQIMPVSQYPNLSFLCLFLFPILVIFQKLIFDFFKPHSNFKFHKVGLINLLFFYFPILIVIGLFVYIYGWNMFATFVLFAVMATIAEYIFGKACQSIISKKLWTYIYLPYDYGHFTPIVILLFGFGGFYFLIVARLFGFF